MTRIVTYTHRPKRAPRKKAKAADALQAIADLDLDTLATIQPPRGYGRD